MQISLKIFLEIRIMRSSCKKIRLRIQKANAKYIEPASVSITWGKYQRDPEIVVEKKQSN